MSELNSYQLSLKQRLVRAGVGLAIGLAIIAWVGRSAAGFIGAGHGVGSLFMVVLGPFAVSLFLFPLVCAAAASKWYPGIVAGLTWEGIYHAITLAFWFQLPGDYDRIRSYGSAEFIS